MQILRACEESGQTIRAYCYENGINECSYYYWKRKLRLQESVGESLASRQEAAIDSASTPAIADITLMAETSRADTITVRLGNAVAEIAGNATPKTVEAVLCALKRLERGEVPVTGKKAK